MYTNKTRFLSSLTVLCLCIAVPAQAATLSTYFGSAYLGTSGSGGFNSGGTPPNVLDGSIEYAVFSPAAYGAIFTNSSVTLGVNELAYVYQVHNTGTGTDTISKNTIVGLLASSGISAIGWADINLGGAGEVSPTGMTLPPPTAVWDFGLNIPNGMSSSALVLVSSNLPSGTTADVVFNGGHIGIVQVVKPGTEAIPEPATALMLVSGTAALMLRRRR